MLNTFTAWLHTLAALIMVHNASQGGSFAAAWFAVAAAFFAWRIVWLK